ncbi:MAG: type II secretion system F family protein [Epsilonproteobacteria bacterium]|nr:type II secretion system F family protein [Campylobacterota bacterium]
MTKYYEVNYLAKGKKNRAVVKAINKIEALNIAKAQIGGTILKINETSVPVEDRVKEITKYIGESYFKRKIKPENLISSIRQLAVMANAGIPIHDSIKEVVKSATDKQVKEMFSKIDEELNAGHSLTEAISKFRTEVGDVTVAMIELGENTGNMAESLQKLANILEEMLENKRKFKKAMRYPITVMIAIAIAFTIMMVYVVPKFKEIFDKFHSELPLPTKILLAMESAVNNYGLFLLGAIFGIIFYIKFMYKTSPSFRYSFDKHILKVYLIGNIIYYSNLSRFMMIFTELIRAGIPVVEALDTAVITTENEYLKEKLSSVKVSVERGVNLTESFRETGLFEGMLIQMIKAGEQGGALDQMLDKVAEYYNIKFQDLIDNISSYIEPIMLGFIAGMVLLLALGIFMPMWDMAQTVKHG